MHLETYQGCSTPNGSVKNMRNGIRTFVWVKILKPNFLFKNT